jgi:uncharacterized protein (TIGR00255 family)
MTGFGTAVSDDPALPVTVTVRSVNHRFLDLTLKTPSRLRSLEPDLRGLVAARLQRGKVELSVRVAGGLEEGPVRLSAARARSAAEALRALKDELRLDGGVTVSDVARVPGVLDSPEAEGDVPSADKILGVARSALETLDATRQAEGAALKAELRAQLEEVRSRAARIGAKVEEGKAARAAALQARGRELLAELGLDSARFYQEAIRSVERHDVSEELDRLRSHATQSEKLLEEDREVGKRLDFFAQELMREANTIGSKAPSADVVAEVVGLKAVVERFREQVQNIE